MLRCKHFQEKTKSAINIWSEMEQIFAEFGLQIGDTPITTDEGANIKASLKSEIRVPCFAHRCSTTLETAWEATRSKSDEFLHLTTSISELRAFIARSGSYQENLPKTIKKTSGTRPWRSYYDVNESGKFHFFLLVWSLLFETSRNYQVFSPAYL
jgi:hypothetical protein